MQLLVIADDFTGALDTGIQFARHGIATTLFLSDALTAGLLADCQADVVVADTESRHLPPDDAAARVRAVTRLAKAAGCPVFYKKTDSTLRGNLGAELTAMQDVCGAKRLFFAPAYPALGRTTRGGTQLVNGVPLARTDFAADPFNPVRTDFVPALLAEQTDRPVRIAAPAALPPEADRPELVVFDADLAGATMTKHFKAAYPQRFFDCGIAEADMMNIAAGLSTMGLVPFCFLGLGNQQRALDEENQADRQFQDSCRIWCNR